MKACNHQRKVWIVDYGYFWSLSALSRVAATLFLSPSPQQEAIHVFTEQLVCVVGARVGSKDSVLQILGDLCLDHCY